jgi:large subunit ribosomal protein L32
LFKNNLTLFLNKCQVSYLKGDARTVGALPKRKISQVRRDRRRAHYLRVKLGHMVPCPQCHVLKLAHHVCPNCGTYKGIEVVKVEEKA